MATNMNGMKVCGIWLFANWHDEPTSNLFALFHIMALWPMRWWNHHESLIHPMLWLMRNNRQGSKMATQEWNTMPVWTTTTILKPAWHYVRQLNATGRSLCTCILSLGPWLYHQTWAKDLDKGSTSLFRSNIVELDGWNFGTVEGIC